MTMDSLGPDVFSAHMANGAAGRNARQLAILSQLMASRLTWKYSAADVETNILST